MIVADSITILVRSAVRTRWDAKPSAYHRLPHVQRTWTPGQAHLLRWRESLNTYGDLKGHRSQVQRLVRPCLHSESLAAARPACPSTSNGTRTDLVGVPPLPL